MSLMYFLCHIVPPAFSTQGPPLTETKQTIIPSENVSNTENLLMFAAGVKESTPDNVLYCGVTVP